jgi:hypothetical protein
MKILISNENHNAHYYERMAWANAFNASGIESVVYNCKTLNAFDVFDKFNPDIYIGQIYNLDEATLKCIAERPHLRVALRAGEYRNEKVPEQVLSTTGYDLKVLDELMKRHGRPEFIYTHYFQDDIESTHYLFKDRYDINLVGVPLSADVTIYKNAQEKDELKCDIGFVGGYWKYKAEVIDLYLTPLLENFNYKAKIFGNRLWHHVNQYCGMIEDEDVKNLFVSSKICPNLSEPHSQQYGIDVNERIFKVLAVSGFCIMDNVARAKEIFKDGAVFVNSPEEFKRAVEYYVSDKSESERKDISRIGRDIVLSDHTNFHRAATMLEAFGEKSQAERIRNAYNSYIQ